MDETAAGDVTIDGAPAGGFPFPQRAGLELAPVALSGVDNRAFRLGDSLSVPPPAGEWYALQVEKAQRWLPVLAPSLPLSSGCWPITRAGEPHRERA